MLEFKDVENYRIKYQNKLKLSITIIIINVLVAIIIPKAILSIPILILLLFVPFIEKEKKEFISAYRTYFRNKVLSKNFTDIKFQEQVGLDKRDIESTKLINMGNKYFTSNLITAKYKDMDFKEAYVSTYEMNNDGEANRSIRFFAGRWIIIDINQFFSDKLEITKDIPSLTVKLDYKGQNSNRYNFTPTSNQKFNEQFNTYVEPGINIERILTPSIMKIIENFSNKLNSPIIIGLYNNYLHIGINDGQTSFLPKCNLNYLNEDEEIAKNSIEIDAIISFIDELKEDGTLFERRF